MKKTLSFFIALLLVTSFVCAQEKVIQPKENKNTISAELWGSGYYYSLNYERTLLHKNWLSLYAKAGGYYYVRSLGYTAALGFKIDRFQHKWTFDFGYAYQYHYHDKLSFDFPVADGSYRYEDLKHITAKASYQAFFLNNKLRLEIGLVGFKRIQRRYDYNSASGHVPMWKEPYILRPLLGIAYTF